MRVVAAAVMLVFLGIAQIGAQPAAPVLVATFANGMVSVGWSEVPGATGYRLIVGSTPGGSDLQNRVVGFNAFASRDVAPGIYYARVTAITSDGESTPSNEVTLVVTNDGGISCPAAPPPPILSSPLVTGSTVTLRWIFGEGCLASDFIVHAGTQPGLSNVAVANVGSMQFLTANAPNGTYFVRVLARNSFGTSGPSNEIAVTIGPGGPMIPAATTFGPGVHRVGIDIEPGRYFSTPSGSCVFQRQAPGALPRVSLGDLQAITDLLPTDLGFNSLAGCGIWSRSASHGEQAQIGPGIWLVGGQVRPGTYRTNAVYGCSWERLRDFAGTVGSVVQNQFVTTAGVYTVTVQPGDVGFSSNFLCGTWSPVP